MEASKTSQPGRLKLFFSYADGAGKAYEMFLALEEACDQGVDGVIGIGEIPAGEPGWEGIQGLEQIAPISPGEFDLDGALRRRPQLIALGSLAHRNGKGCRHRRRFQDVEELLRAGIDVYTTLNVGEIESLADIVQSITGKEQADRIPDRIFDQAYQVQMVDLEPEELLKRMSGRETLTKKQLEGLRQLAFRRIADRLSRREAEEGKDPYGKEHILICLSGAPSNAKVIRAAARMSDASHSLFTALFVESADTRQLDEKSRTRLGQNARLAEDLGATIATVYGDDLPLQISEYAKASGVTRVVIGRPGRRKWWEPSQKSVVDRLMELSPQLDVYIIPDNPPAGNVRYYSPQRFRFSPSDLFKSAGMVLLCSLIGLLFQQAGMEDDNIIIVYILGVLINSLITSDKIYGGLSCLASVIVFDYLFTQPRYSFWSYDAGYSVTFLTMFAASFITSTLAARVKNQTKMAVQKAYRTQVLLETSQKLQQVEGTGEIFSACAQQLIKLLDCTVLLYPVTDAGELGEPSVYFAPGEEDASPYRTPSEQEAALWVYRNNKHAGATTNTFPEARCLYLAVRGRKNVLAVAAIGVHPDSGLGAFEKSLLIAMLGECGMAMEKNASDLAKQEAEIKARQEELRANLLRAISHDLRTPLTSISGNAGVLMGNSKILDEEKKQQLYTDIYDDSIWLINLVENLLSITRIENGTVRLNLAPELLEDLVGEAMTHLSRRAGEHTITTHLEEELLMADCDARLIIQVLVNLVDNAVKYTPPGSHITVSAHREGEMIRVEVADDGSGISPEAKEKLFEMFYTAGSHRADGRRGLGLGLSLCRSIVAAHGGEIAVRDQIPHGSVFSFTLPATKVEDLSLNR